VGCSVVNDIFQIVWLAASSLQLWHRFTLANQELATPSNAPRIPSSTFVIFTQRVQRADIATSSFWRRANFRS
jgi:hypothetical protein